MANQEIKSLYHCVYSLNYHLVLVTKYRLRCITLPMLQRLHDICRRSLEHWGGTLKEFNGESDHIHLLIEFPPKAALSDFVNNLKTVTSRLIRKEFASHLSKVYRKPVFWSRSYCIISCGGAPLSILMQYIEQQQNPG